MVEWGCVVSNPKGLCSLLTNGEKKLLITGLNRLYQVPERARDNFLAKVEKLELRLICLGFVGLAHHGDQGLVHDLGRGLCS